MKISVSDYVVITPKPIIIAVVYLKTKNTWPTFWMATMYHDLHLHLTTTWLSRASTEHIGSLSARQNRTICNHIFIFFIEIQVNFIFALNWYRLESHWIHNVDFCKSVSPTLYVRKKCLDKVNLLKFCLLFCQFQHFQEGLQNLQKSTRCGSTKNQTFQVKNLL